jgi:hypothetical protein
MLLYLQWSTELRSQQINGIAGQDIFRFSLTGAGLQQPVDILTLAGGDPVQGENIGPVANLFHRQAA